MELSLRGAHLLLQIWTRVLNEEWENTFRTWYPALRPKVGAEVNNELPDPPESSALQHGPDIEGPSVICCAIEVADCISDQASSWAVPIRLPQKAVQHGLLPLASTLNAALDL
jgi:hypothetical protein